MEGTIRRCPALGTGSGHHHGEGNPTAYLRTGDAGESFQPGWRQCSKCECLFFAGSSRPLGKCPVDGAPHSPTDTPYSVGTYRLARLPVPAKAAVGKRVALRIADKGVLSFFKIADCTWRVVGENELRVEAKWGTSPYFRLDLIMVHGPACLMSFEAGGRWSLDVLNWSVANYTIPPTNVTATLPCLNVDVTQASEFEWAPGRNNGVGLKITGLGSVIPVSDNRVRLSLDVPLPGLPPGIDLELLTGRA